MRSAILLRFRLAGLVCAGMWLAAVGAGVCRAHGGPPLRLGVTADPIVSAVGRLVLVHLREGVGFAVDWREYPDEAALRAAFTVGGVDIAVALTGERQPAPVASGTAGCPSDKLASLSDELGRRWGGEVFLLELPPGPAGCSRPTLVVSRAVLEDLRFGILRKESARMASLIGQDDIASVVGAAGSGGERAATAAARAALASKARR